MATLPQIELQEISREQIKAIDIYITNNESAFADICITTNEIYYCLGTEDMREDGHTSISEREFSDLYQGIIQSIKNDDSRRPSGSIKFKLSFTLTDAEKISLNQETITPHSISKIIECLSNECDEFIFLEGFKSLLR